VFLIFIDDISPKCEKKIGAMFHPNAFFWKFLKIIAKKTSLVDWICQI
jgi:hypothetical protein